MPDLRLLLLLAAAAAAAFHHPIPGRRRSPLRATPAGAPSPPDGLRLNKALKAVCSRRQADKLIAAGEVRVNGAPASLGTRLVDGDAVEVRGQPVDWAQASSAATQVYLRYWKPGGVTCTTDRRVKDNVLDALGPEPSAHGRVFMVGRLDKPTTGLLLLTSDGALCDGVLRSKARKDKTYLVETYYRATGDEIDRLRKGVVITTLAQRDGAEKELTAATLPCVVERAAGHNGNALKIVLQEGRNRQIRKMCEAVGLRVRSLHRTAFAGVTLQGLTGEGDWEWLTARELALLRSTDEDGTDDRAAAAAGAAAAGGGTDKAPRAADWKTNW